MLLIIESLGFETVWQIVQRKVPKRIIARVRDGGIGQLPRGVDGHGKFCTDVGKQSNAPTEILLKTQCHRHFEQISQLPLVPFFDFGTMFVFVAKFVGKSAPDLSFGEVSICAIIAHTHAHTNAHVRQKIVGIAHINGERRKIWQDFAAHQIVTQLTHTNAAAHLQVRAFLTDRARRIGR